MRKALVLGTAAAAIAGGAFAAQPASAADSTVTFTAGLTGSTVSILPSVAVVGVTSGDTVTGLMTSVITDLRPLSGTWSDSISSTDFVLVGATDTTGANRVPASSAKVYSPTAVVTVPGTATITNTHATLPTALTLGNSAAALLSANTTNVNVTTVASTVVIDVTGKNAGAYTGTITQTVS